MSPNKQFSKPVEHTDKGLQDHHDPARGSEHPSPDPGAARRRDETPGGIDVPTSVDEQVRRQEVDEGEGEHRRRDQAPGRDR